MLHLLRYIFPAFFGMGAGMLGGFFLVYLLPKGYLPGLVPQYIAGAIIAPLWSRYRLDHRRSQRHHRPGKSPARDRRFFRHCRRLPGRHEAGCHLDVVPLFPLADASLVGGDLELTFDPFL